MITFYFLILASWAVFLVVLATTVNKVQPEAAVPQDEGNYVGLYITVATAALLFFRGHIFGSSSHYYAFVGAHHIVGLAGTVLCALGALFAIFARVQSTRAEGEKLPLDPALYIQYPMYAGVLIAMVGSALVGGIPWALIAVASASYISYRVVYAENLIPEKTFAALRIFGTFRQFKHRARNLMQVVF